MNSEPIRVAVVEDQPLYRRMLVTLLEQQDGVAVVSSAGGAAEALRALDPVWIEVLLLDVDLGDGDGIALGRRLRRDNPRLGIILLSAIDAMDTLLELPRAERRGWSYLSKTSALGEHDLMAAIRASSAGRTVLDRQLLDRRRARAGSVLRALTERQFEVLTLVAEGLSNAGVAERLDITTRTVDTHLTALYAALGLHADEGHNLRVEAALAYLRETRGAV